MMGNLLGGTLRALLSELALQGTPSNICSCHPPCCDARWSLVVVVVEAGDVGTPIAHCVPHSRCVSTLTPSHFCSDLI